MAALVVLKFTEGSWEQGFPVVLQIAEAGQAITTEMAGKLPANPHLPQLYGQWQAAYQALVHTPRLSAKLGQTTKIPSTSGLQQLAQQLQAEFQQWLTAESFRGIRETWLEKLASDQAVRVVLQTADSIVQGLPWHLWDIVQRYGQAEIALSRPSFDRIAPTVKRSNKVRILVIIGNSEGIDTTTDVELLRQLPQVDLEVLQEPSRRQLSDALWEQTWDILFFAGHSSSQPDRAKGRLAINAQDHLSLSELKYALERALNAGLELAIFNSCDGLGLAQELATLKIPELIVMREMVPDRVAQKFLQYFLSHFSQGDSLSVSVRQARQRLQALEDEAPCATWLPVLFQNPAHTPPTWQSLCQGKVDPADLVPDPQISPIPNISPIPPIPAAGSPNAHRVSQILRCTGLGFLSGCVMLALRSLGALQDWELQTLDRMMRMRPAEPTDSRILLVTIDETDIQEQPDRGQGSLSDTALNQLLQQLTSYQPRAIGLDLYRDFPTNVQQLTKQQSQSKQQLQPKQQSQPKQKSQPKQPFQLKQQLQQLDHLITLCKHSDAEGKQAGIAASPDVPIERVGFSDFISDRDGVLRRQLMFMNPDPASPCLATYGFGTRLAIEYLFSEGHEAEFTPDGKLQFGKTLIPTIRRPMGGYQTIDDRGGQILLNYRSGNRPFQQVSLMQVLRGQVAPELVKDRVILIGTIATSAGDYWMTPLGRSTDAQLQGVVIQAHMTSQLLNHVLDRRPLIHSWSKGDEIAWILGWTVVGIGLISCVQHCWLKHSILGTIAIFGVFWGGFLFGGYALLLRGLWVPVVPPIAGIGLATLILVVSPKHLGDYESNR
ncbi:CHASE2 domain-containing protein [Alkalinema sp. FACHB-956]|uniref:CHASE2 domain-containing protein n=1 Tax=Alkalinema sp. FACHB-956 TaxID=2692768 RepID=UPI0016897146|nr:CHASE2 domain-containing protein [Alkalinema sp. FACHB-956]MBD2325778.1 CHASE2 domain-containing protein [Alkalinema sp. FACHB-956]